MPLSRPFSVVCDDLPLWQRATAVVCVLLIHLGVALLCWQQPDLPKVQVNEMSVSFMMLPAVIEKIEPAKRTPTSKAASVVQESAAPKALPVADAPVAPTLANTPASHIAGTDIAAPVVVVADSVPDYQAVYLHNPRPVYPAVAQRMGWQGRVILNVEVLSEGICGAINVARSSGHEVLDAAAIAAVKSWRFSPASHAGHVVTQWFKLPVNFSLEEGES